MQVVRNNAKDGGWSSQRRAPLWHQLSEPALVDRARARSAGAFEELVGRTERHLYRVAMRVVRNESDAQDILQEAYLSAWRSLPKFEGRSQFGSWMHRIVVNHSLMHLRTRNRHPEVGITGLAHTELEDAIAQATYPSTSHEFCPARPDQQLQSRELLRHIESTVNLLPEKLKEIFLLRDIREVSTEEAAVQLGVSLPTAKIRLHRSRKVLRRCLGDHLVC